MPSPRDLTVVMCVTALMAFSGCTATGHRNVNWLDRWEAAKSCTELVGDSIGVRSSVIQAAQADLLKSEGEPYRKFTKVGESIVCDSSFYYVDWLRPIDTSCGIPCGGIGGVIILDRRTLKKVQVVVWGG